MALKQETFVSYVKSCLSAKLNTNIQGWRIILVHRVSFHIMGFTIDMLTEISIAVGGLATP